MKVTVTIKKDFWEPSKRWSADLVTDDGFHIKSWMSRFKTKKAMLAEIYAVRPDAVIVG